MNYKRIKIFSLLLIFFYSSVQPSEYYQFAKRHWKEISILGGAAYLLWKMYPSKLSSKNQQQDNDSSSASSSSMQSDSNSGEQNSGKQKERCEIYELPSCHGFKYGIQSIQNERNHQEDRYQVTKISDKIAYFGVFDGHGGCLISEFLKNALHVYFKIPDLSADIIVNAFRKANEDVYRLNYPDDNGMLPCEREGSTALVAFLDSEKQKLTIANAGDCRAVICKNGKAIALSNDHKASNEHEKKRVREAGGYIILQGCHRVGGFYNLAVTRSFGDKWIKGVVCDPEVVDYDLDKDCEFLILASDGLWDGVSNDSAVKLVKSMFNLVDGDRCQKAARMLTRLAVKNGSHDNITVIIIDLQNN